jgi:elongation factor Ts
VPAGVLEAQRRAFTLDAEQEAKPAERVAGIVEGKLNKWLETACLLELPYRDTDRKIADLITEKVALLGENIRVARFARMAVGETVLSQAAVGPEAA